MLHLRIIGIAWSALGILGTCGALFDLFRNISRRAFEGVITSDFIALTFCITAIFAGYGISHHRRWGRVVCSIVAVVLLLSALSYLLILVGLEYGVTSYAVMWAATLFSVYSLFTTVRYGGKASGQT